MNTIKETLYCPRCGKELAIEPVRKHVDGRERIYWECVQCNLSIMDRGRGRKEGD